MLDRLNIGRDIGVITGRSIDRDDLGHRGQMPLTDIEVSNQVVPVQKTGLPGSVRAIAALTAIASRTANVAQTPIDRTPSGAAKAGLMQKERQGIGRVNVVVSTIGRECLSQVYRRRVVGSKHRLRKLIESEGKLAN